MQFTRACAVAWAPDNIQVNAILPGWIDTDLTKRARQQVDGLHEHGAGAHAGGALGRASTTSPASPCSCLAAPRTSSPAPRSRSTAASR